MRFFVPAILFFPPAAVFAQCNPGEICNPIGASSFIDIANKIADFATAILAPIAVIVILYAGLLFMTSAGNVEKVKRARQALTWALVGLAIVLIGKGFILIIQNALGVSGG